MNFRPPRPLILALIAHALVLLATMPRSPWEFDEPLFFQALHKYDPVAHHPPPPGYPVFIHVAQVVRMLVPSDFGTLVALSIVSSLIGFALFALAFRNLTGELSAGIAGAMFFYWSPALLIHATLPVSETGSLALIAAALYCSTLILNDRSSRPNDVSSRAESKDPLLGLDDRPSAGDPSTSLGMTRDQLTGLFAVFAALAVGWRIQYSIFVVPFFLAVVAMMRTWRARAIALGAFTLVCLMWLTPLTTAVGGSYQDLINYELKQGKYLAAHDADQSRTGWSPARLAFRFIGRAWGTEWMALIVLGIAAYGFVKIFRRRAIIPLLAGAAVYIGVALWIMDPADGVRYSIPFVLATAFFAGVGSREKPYVIPAVAAVVFLFYTGTLLKQRRTTISPPVRAANYIRQNLPPNGAVLYELALWPHSQYFLRDRNPHRLDDGLEKFYNRPDVPLFVYADGATIREDAKVFRWEPSDAYIKLTRNHYRSVSVIPVPPERRFRKVTGVYAQEREQDGREWRWLAPSATVQLPDGPERSLTLRIGLGKSTPIEANTITVFVNDQEVAKARVERGRSTNATVDVPAGAPLVKLVSERNFIPAEVPALRSGDRRQLSVELYELRTAPRTGR